MQQYILCHAKCRYETTCLFIIHFIFNLLVFFLRQR